MWPWLIRSEDIHQIDLMFSNGTFSTEFYDSLYITRLKLNISSHLILLGNFLPKFSPPDFVSRNDDELHKKRAAKCHPFEY